MKQLFICEYCKSEFREYASKRSLKLKFCNKKCESKWKKEVFYIVPENRLCCNTWQGKKHTKETKEKMSKNMSGIKKRPLTKKEKELQRSFWNKDRREFQRKTMEEKGLWTPLDQIEDWELYKVQSNWIRRMFDLLSPEELLYLRKYGVYNIHKNKNGVVRHHKYSRASGFKYRVFPVILRHPCNLGVLRNIENTRHDRNDLELESLFQMIESYDKEWIEQKECINCIKKYKNGERWNKLNCLDMYIVDEKKKYRSQ